MGLAGGLDCGCGHPVNALSGYLIPDAGHDVTFSIVTNGTGLPSAAVRRAMDDVVAAITPEAGR